MKHFAIGLLCGSLFLGGLFAQETPGVTFSAGAGFTTPVNATGSNFDMGWNAGIGAGFNFLPWVGALVDANFDHMGVASTDLSGLGYAGGSENVFSTTLDPIIHLNPRGHTDVYLTGGGGIYHLWQNFSLAPATTAGDQISNMFIGGGGGSYSINKPGFDAGLGVAFGSKWHGKFFAEARFNRVFLGGHYFDYLPVTFGFRR